MAKLSRLAGSTGHVLTLFIQDSTQTDGRGLTGVTNATSGLACSYKRNTASAATAISLDTITTLGTYGTYAAGHGGFKEIDSANLPGFYEFQPPDAALATGARSVAFLLRGAANMVPCPVEVELTATDNQNATNGGVGNLDATVSSRLAATSYTAPPSAGAIASAVMGDVTDTVGADVVSILSAVNTLLARLAQAIAFDGAGLIKANAQVLPNPAPAGYGPGAGGSGTTAVTDLAGGSNRNPSNLTVQNGAGQPVQGATVTAYNAAAYAANPGTAAVLAIATTDANGHWTLNIPTGEGAVTLVVAASGELAQVVGSAFVV